MKSITTVLISALFCAPASDAIAQINPKTIQSETTEFLEQVQAVRDNNKPEGRTITTKAFEKILDSLLYSVSGTAIKNGKAVRTSFTADDKSGTLNFTFIDSYRFTVQATGTAQSKKSFADIFSSGKFGNTYSYGFNILYYPSANSMAPAKGAKNRIVIKTEKLMNRYLALSKLATGRDIDRLIEIFNGNGKYYLGNEDITTPMTTADAELYDKEKAEFDKLLSKYSAYLPDNFNILKEEFQKSHFKENIIDAVSEVYLHRLYKEETDSLNAIQMKADFSHKWLKYWSFGLRYNNSKYPVFNETATDNLYTSNLGDNYPSLNVSWNFIHLFPTHNLMILPTAKIQHNRDFDEDNLVYLNVPQGNQIIGGVSTSEYKQTSYYNVIPERETHINIDVPVSIFFPQSPIPFGFEIAANTDVAPTLKNVGGRIGAYLVLPAGKQNLTIEPIIKINKLEQKDKSFMKDQFSFGINLSVTLPEIFSKKQ
jgi:hypothetical protein